MKLELTKSSTDVCWTWSISETGCSIPPVGRTVSPITTRWRAFSSFQGQGRGYGHPGRGLRRGGRSVPGLCRGRYPRGHHGLRGQRVFDILAEDLARRDMDDVPIDDSNCEELNSRIDAYIAEFEEHGTDNLTVDSDIL